MTMAKTDAELMNVEAEAEEVLKIQAGLDRVQFWLNTAKA